MKNNRMANVALLLLLVAESAIAEDDFSKKTKTMSTCDVVKSLIAEHRNGFESLRGRRLVAKEVTIWQARYHVVGNGCEIWNSDREDAFYVCTRSAPTEDVANEYYSNSREKFRACLGKQWTEAEVPRQGGGTKTTFSHGDSKLAFEIHEVKVEGVRGSQWTIYYLAGGSLNPR